MQKGYRWNLAASTPWRKDFRADSVRSHTRRAARLGLYPHRRAVQLRHRLPVLLEVAGGAAARNAHNEVREKQSGPLGLYTAQHRFLAAVRPSTVLHRRYQGARAGATPVRGGRCRVDLRRGGFRERAGRGQRDKNPMVSYNVAGFPQKVKAGNVKSFSDGTLAGSGHTGRARELEGTRKAEGIEEGA